jgi:hypothetical protein
MWHPRGAAVGFTPRGYLAQPGPLASLFNSQVMSLESITETPCLVLLGEPGIGKSYSMRMAKDAICAQAEQSGGTLLWLDLHSYGSEDRLIRALFEKLSFRDWLEGEHRLHLFLDSLDECLLRVNTVAGILEEELSRCPVERLSLRIACRTVDWPISLERALERLWGQDSVKVYEMAPLQRRDIAEAARANGLSAEAFLGEVDRVDVVPLAIKPVTLNFLLNSFLEDGRFPSTQIELYRRGCRLLCEETNEGRRDARLTGSLTGDERLAVASRIAAVTVFANKAAIWTHLDQGDVPDDDVTVRILAGGDEPLDGGRLHVSERAVREALATGLFSSRGPNRLGWAHQTYAEFLAARYLFVHEAPLSQTLSLITVPGYRERRIVPQLAGTAAWLAGMIPDVSRIIRRTDPLIVMRSDLDSAADEDRAAVVSEILSAYDAENLLHRSAAISLHGGRLDHPGLAGQLRPYITDQQRSVVVRVVASDIAESCQLSELQEELAEIVLDPSEPYELRVNCAYAVHRIGDKAVRAKLMPLIFGGLGDDPYDELKGCGLLANWPGNLTAGEMFSVLTSPQRDSFVGAYSKFLHECADHLELSDLLTALQWVEQQPTRHNLSYAFNSLLDAILFRSWENLEMPGCLMASRGRFLPGCDDLTTMSQMISPGPSLVGT